MMGWFDANSLKDAIVGVNSKPVQQMPDQARWPATWRETRQNPAFAPLLRAIHRDCYIKFVLLFWLDLTQARRRQARGGTT